MTKDEIIELQAVVARGRLLFWQLLMRGAFPSEDHAKAVFTCFFALDKVSGLVTHYITQLPLEEPATCVNLEPLFQLPGIRELETTPIVNSKTPGTPHLRWRQGEKK